MTAQLQKEAEEDAEAYESMACWCETRDKEKAEFVQEEKDMTVSIMSLKNAVITLSKTHSEIQTNSVLNLIRSHAESHKQLVPRWIFNLIQVQQKTPASGEIFGVLKQMK